jgi:hypothetical protein
MNPFDCPLPIDKVHGLLNDPRDLSREEFECLAVHLSILSLDAVKRRTLAGSVMNATVALGLTDSNSDCRKLMKNGGLFVNKIQIRDDRQLEESDFFDTGCELMGGPRLRYCVVRKGKNSHQLVFSRAWEHS